MLQKLEKTLFFVFLILIPFQIRTFLVNNGEWNSVFVYLGDIVLFLVFVLFVMRKLKINKFQISNFKFQKDNLLLIIFLVIAFISIFVSTGTKISAFRWLKLVEFVMLFMYITLNYGPKAPKVLGPRTNILRILVLGGVFQAVLAIAQFIKQGNIGIKFIEAGVFRPNLPGVANFSLNKELIMRSYGSFSHPNVLSAFILLAIFCLYTILISNFEFRISNQILISKIRKFNQNSKLKIQNFVLLFSLPILIFGLFLTFSRGTIMVFLVGSLAMFLIEFFKLRKLEHTEQRLKNGKKLIKLFGLVIVSCALAVVILFPYIRARFFTISLQEQAIDLRFFYNKIALSMIKDKPILGIGMGNFVNYSHNYSTFLRAALKMLSISGPIAEGDLGQNQIPDWIFQPEHNIYLLIASEIGILGLIIFLIFIGRILLQEIKKVFRGEIVSCVLVLVFCFLIMALADHYFWTLQSGGIMFWLALGLIKIND